MHILTKNLVYTKKNNTFTFTSINNTQTENYIDITNYNNLLFI